MNKVWLDLRGLKSGLLFIPILYELLILSSILLSNEARSLFYYNELFMLPLIVMITGVFFQREFAGLMELVAVLPISLPILLLRKFMLIVVTVVVMTFIWTLTYFYKFGQLRTLNFHYDGSKPHFGDTTVMHLLMQAGPGYVFIIAVTILGIVVTKKLAGGFLIGFSLWMFFSLVGAKDNYVFSLYTAYLKKPDLFVENQWILISLATVCLFVSMLVIRRRARWVVEDDE